MDFFLFQVHQTSTASTSKSTTTAATMWIEDTTRFTPGMCCVVGGTWVYNSMNYDWIIIIFLLCPKFIQLQRLSLFLLPQSGETLPQVSHQVLHVFT